LLLLIGFLVNPKKPKLSIAIEAICCPNKFRLRINVAPIGTNTTLLNSTLNIPSSPAIKRYIGIFLDFLAWFHSYK